MLKAAEWTGAASVCKGAAVVKPIERTVAHRAKRPRFRRLVFILIPCEKCRPSGRIATRVASPASQDSHFSMFAEV